LDSEGFLKSSVSLRSPAPLSKGAQLIEIENTINTLSKSQNKNEKFSAEINKLLLEYYQKYGKLTVIHHYYIE
jgi:hypothetical protein